jgi:hypothetical protein
MQQQFANMEQPRLGQQMRHESYSEAEEELIPTAIVIKNIPFAVKKETLVQVMTLSTITSTTGFSGVLHSPTSQLRKRRQR